MVYPSPISVNGDYPHVRETSERDSRDGGAALTPKEIQDYLQLGVSDEVPPSISQSSREGAAHMEANGSGVMRMNDVRNHADGSPPFEDLRAMNSAYPGAHFRLTPGEIQSPVHTGLTRNRGMSKALAYTSPVAGWRTLQPKWHLVNGAHDHMSGSLLSRLRRIVPVPFRSGFDHPRAQVA